MNIYDQISTNKHKTWFTMFSFVLLLSLMGFVFGEIYGGAELGIPLLGASFLFSSISAVSSYYFSDRVALSIAKAKKLDRTTSPKLYGILENLCIGAGIKKIPDLYIIDDGAPNAFATGRDPDHAAIAVTSGLIEKLDKRQIEGVLSHELSHIRNYDIRLMTIVVVLVGMVTIVANVMSRSKFRGSSNRKSGIFFLLGIVLALLSPLVANIIKLAISRNREYLADASGALLTRDPEGLAQALKIISSDKEALEVANEAMAHMYISNPFKKGKNTGWFSSLFDTHPPVRERIKRLRKM